MHSLTARWILPIDLPPIQNGEVVIDGAKIVYCGPLRDPETRDHPLEDFGDAIIMPGLVNVHTHLEYTALRGFLEDVEFFPWIRTLTAMKAHCDRDDWLVSAMLGGLECISAGITTIGDNTDAGVTAQAASELGLRARIYQEVFGIDHCEPVEPIVAALEEKLGNLLTFSSGRIEIGVSPHALYTVRPALFEALQRYTAKHNLRTSIHIAESPAESELTERGEGPFWEMFKRRGIEWSVPKVSPTRYLSDLGALNPSTLCVHCIHQDAADIELMRDSGASIAHCPKSNAKLGAGVAPLKEWLTEDKLSSRVALGTDSAVSNNTLDLFEEMRFGLFSQRAKHERIELSAVHMVEMATLGGARAMGWEHKVGSLTVGKQADLIAVRLDSLHTSPATDPYAALVYSARADDVCLTMVDGRILYRNGVFTGADTEEVRRRSIDLRRRLSTQPLLVV